MSMSDTAFLFLSVKKNKLCHQVKLDFIVSAFLGRITVAKQCLFYLFSVCIDVLCAVSVLFLYTCTLTTAPLISKVTIGFSFPVFLFSCLVLYCRSHALISLEVKVRPDWMTTTVYVCLHRNVAVQRRENRGTKRENVSFGFLVYVFATMRITVNEKKKDHANLVYNYKPQSLFPHDAINFRELNRAKVLIYFHVSFPTYISTTRWKILSSFQAKKQVKLKAKTLRKNIINLLVHIQSAEQHTRRAPIDILHDPCPPSGRPHPTHM